MPRSKPIHKNIIKRIKRDEGFRWEADYVNWLRDIQRSAQLNANCRYSNLLHEQFLCLQQESFVRALDEQRVALQEADDNEAYVYPGLTLAWEAAPLSLDIEPGLLKKMAPFDIDLLEAPLKNLDKFFPSCLSIDVRELGFSMHGVDVDVMFAYPSYDVEREHAMLLLLGVSTDNGLMFPLQSKLVLKGDTFRDAIKASIDEQKYLADMWWGENRTEGLVEAFSPLDDDLEFMKFAAHLLAALCSDSTRLNRSERKSCDHIWASNMAERKSQKEPGTASDSVESEEKGSVSEDILDAEETLVFSDETRIQSLESTVESLRSKIASLTYSLELAHATAAKLQQHTAATKNRAELLETMSIPTTPSASLSLAAEAFRDKLVFLDDAIRSCCDYKGSPSEVWAVLREIACHLHPLIFSENSGDIASRFQSETGFELALRDTKATGSNSALKKLRSFEYKGNSHDATPHVKGKGSKRGQSLRVHFFADYDAQKIVIAHCGEHLETTSSSNQ